MDTSSVIILTVLMAAAVLDALLAATWSPAYFRHGLPLFFKRFPARPQWNPAFPAASLDAEFTRPCFYSLAFRELSPTVYAFRERLFHISWLRYLLVMHGLVEWDFARSRITVTGYANIFPVAFALANVLLMVQGTPPWSVLVFLGTVAIITLSFATQAFLYLEVGKYAARRWSRLDTTFGADA